MAEPVDIEVTPHDPLLSKFELPRRAAHYPAGFPLDIETNSEEVIRAAAIETHIIAAARRTVYFRDRIGHLQSLRLSQLVFERIHGGFEI
jgi:hypothetical protein